MPGVAQHEARTGETGAYRGTDITLEQLEQRVRKAVTQ
jgi:NAD(P)H-dependent flavin oxidoreductase YrpB (nitropropane dioxygenase family)